MITAEDAKKIIDARAAEVYRTFEERHKKFMNSLSKAVKTQSEKGSTYLKTILPKDETFPPADRKFLFQYLESLGYMVRTLDERDGLDADTFGFELMWKEA